MDTGSSKNILGFSCSSASAGPANRFVSENSEKHFLYVGNRIEKPSSWNTGAPLDKGVGIFQFDPSNGSLLFIKSVFETISVGEMCIDPERNILYAVDEVMTRPGFVKGGGGTVYAFLIDPETGDLTEINRQPSFGSLPSHLAIDKEGNYLIVTHHTGNAPVTKTVRDETGKFRLETEYDDATTVLFRLNGDGSIADPCDVVIHSGSGPDAEQTHPRVHSVVRAPGINLFAVCDKGSDAFFIYRINRDAGKLEVCADGPLKTPPGSLPRSSAFHPIRPYLYLNFEGQPIIAAYRYDNDGALRLIDKLKVVADDLQLGRKDMQSDIKVHPFGKYLYTLIREINSVSVFKIKEQTGELKRIQTLQVSSFHPRSLEFSPDGKFMVIAAPKSEEVVVWAIDSDGTVSPTNVKACQPSPGNAKFISL